MAEFPAMPLFCEPLLADTDHLSDAEMGLYMRLLAKLWLAPNNRFPNDDEWLARKFRKSPEQVRTELRPLLDEFFKTTGNHLFHKRLDKEASHVKRVTAARSASAKARWDKEKAASERNAPTPTPTKKEKKEAPSGASKEKPEPRGSRISPDWQPTETDIAFALNAGMDHDDVRRESAKFRDYWLGADRSKARKSDWAAVWRTWVQNAIERRGPAPRSGGNGSGGGGDRRADSRQAGRLADTLAVLHRRGSLEGLGLH